MLRHAPEAIGPGHPWIGYLPLPNRSTRKIIRCRAAFQARHLSLRTSVLAPESLLCATLQAHSTLPYWPPTSRDRPLWPTVLSLYLWHRSTASTRPRLKPRKRSTKPKRPIFRKRLSQGASLGTPDLLLRFRNPRERKAGGNGFFYLLGITR